MESLILERDRPVFESLLRTFIDLPSTLNHLLRTHDESCGCHLEDEAQKSYNKTWNQKKLQFLELHKLWEMDFEDCLNRILRILLRADVSKTDPLPEAEFWALLRGRMVSVGDENLEKILPTPLVNEEDLDDIHSYIEKEMTSASTSASAKEPYIEDKVRKPREGILIDCTGISASFGLSWNCHHCKIAHSSKYDCAHYSFLHKSEPPINEECVSVRPEGVKALRNLKRGSRFGPLMGRVLDEKDIDFDEDREGLWLLYGENGVRKCINSIKDWMGMVKRATDCKDANLFVISSGDRSYFVAARDISVGEELKVYAKEDPLTEFWTCRSQAWANQLKCNRCSSKNTFTNVSDYRAHISLWHDLSYDGNPLNRVYYCPDCGIKSIGAKEAVRHSRESHSSFPFICRACFKRFETYNSLSKHKSRIHERGKPMKRTCDICGKSYSDSKAWKLHIEQVHRKSDQLRCEKCSSIFSSRYALNRHRREIHDQKQEYACLKCHRHFSQPSNLKQHMLIHTGKKPFQCRDCSSAFTTKQCLQVHYRKVHKYRDEDVPVIVKRNQIYL